MQRGEDADRGPVAGPPGPVAVTPEKGASSAMQGPVSAGTILGERYRVAERIGSGGMATIYRGYDLTLERAVAVKVLHSHLAGDEELQARFRTEARHAASLSHPHIVGVYDQGVADLPYIVMELIDGLSLREVLDERGQLPPPEALAVLEPVARALGRAHRAGVVHRDVKPENVLVAADGTPKVADFGVARVVAGTSHTQTGALIGSVHYMAPELVDGQEASQASDQYALGVVLYELLTGRRPFAGDSPMAVALRHTRDRVPPPSQEGASCGAAVDEVVARATRHEPQDRYPDLDAFADELREAVPGGPAAVVVKGPDDGQTLIIPAESQETMSVVVASEVAARRAVGPPDGGPRMPGSSRTPRGRGQPEVPTTDSGAGPADVESRRSGGVRRAVIASLLTLLLLAGAAGGAYAWWHYMIAPITPVPELVGLSEAAAFDETADAGLGLTVSEEIYDFDAPEGHVLSQDPAPDTELRRGEDISVVLSRGPQPVAVPDVVGETEAEAVERLGADRLEATLDTAYHDEVAEGTVMSQEPSPGESVLQGDEVALVVSLGIEQVEVPTLTGRQVDEAEEALAAAGLALGEVTRTYSDEVPQAGEIISQSLEGGASVDKGSAVNLTASLGPRTIEVPDVRGESVEDARATVQDRGLDVEVVVESRPRLGPFVRGSVGLVEEQLPEAGSPIARGEPVTLFTFGEE